VGLRNDKDLDQALGVARGFQPLTEAELQALLDKVAEQASDGRHELFKTSKVFDGPYHRKQHGFSTEIEQPG
jgi:uncharacterized protein